MEITFDELQEKEVINILAGNKLGRIIDVVFDISTASLKGFIVPGERKLFKKSEEIFIPLRQVKKIGDDVILVQIEGQCQKFDIKKENQITTKFYSQKTGSNGSYIRFRKIPNYKYK